MRAAGGRAQYVSCSASARVVRDGGPSAVENAPRHRRVAARRSARGVRCVGPCQWDVRASALRSPASAGARGKCSHAFTGIAEGDSNLSSFLRSALMAWRATPRSPFPPARRLPIVSPKSSHPLISYPQVALPCSSPSEFLPRRREHWGRARTDSVTVTRGSVRVACVRTCSLRLCLAHVAQ